ncbi:unnamed protein product [Acanthoscelides obtectus]|uniref:Golgi to ER traffic protein 4 homolog n=1 Tax=Acanthoscelides obtectus TaxID=200917 RepID=A0A9P0PII8_ACAOB|nr:unnamed protein product [Acanthoscelides obtectus]CAK1677064.1 Golgi to ER traffic protein 4 homolog [Acanthoscelides obtectus]
MAATAQVRGISRVLEKLEKSVKDGNFYEAHQMYRTLYFRYLGQKKYKELKDMLYNGALLFLEHDQQLSGADLAILLVDVLEKSEENDYVTWASKLSKVFGRLSSLTPERDTFLAHAIRWSSKGSTHGHPVFHRSIALVYWEEKNYAQARHHFIYSQDGKSCAKLLIEFHMKQGFKGEADLFIAQAVLQYLCLKNKNTANQTFTSYTEQHPRIRRTSPPYLFPLLNFIWFLLKAIESQKLQTFAVLCEQYEPSIKRDPCYIQYLDKIGQIFFGLQPPRQERSGGLFGNIFESFLGSLEDDSDDEPVHQQRSTASHQTPSTSTSSRQSATERLVENQDLD